MFSTALSLYFQSTITRMMFKSIPFIFREQVIDSLQNPLISCGFWFDKIKHLNYSKVKTSKSFQNHAYEKHFQKYFQNISKPFSKIVFFNFAKKLKNTGLGETNILTKNLPFRSLPFINLTSLTF